MSDSEKLIVMRTLSGYPKSCNYGDLWDLAQRQSVVCIVDYDEGLRDVAQTIWMGYEPSSLTVGARGICYASGRNREGFCAAAGRVNLEWIVPSQSDQGKKYLERRLFADENAARGFAEEVVEQALAGDDGAMKLLQDLGVVDGVKDPWGLGLGIDVTREANAQMITREEWGAKPFRGTPKPQPRYDSIVIHHTAGAQTREMEASRRVVRGVQQDHHERRGWNDIGYHFLIDAAGRVFQGRPMVGKDLAIGSHVGGKNTGKIGICLLGCYEPSLDGCDHEVTEETLEALVVLCASLCASYGVDREAIDGHCDHAATVCPGSEVVAALPELRRRVKGLNVEPVDEVGTWRATGIVKGSKYLGEFEGTKEEVREAAMESDEAGDLTLCVHCSELVGDISVEDVELALVDDSG